MNNFLANNVTLFKDFPTDIVIEIIEKSKVKSFEKHEAIIEFSEQGIFLGVLLEGNAELSFTDNNGIKHVLNDLEPGDIFGEISLMTGNKTIADVVCGSPCRVLIIPQDVFTELITTNPPAVNYLSKTVEEKLKAISYDLEQSEFAKASAKKHDDPYGLKLHTKLPLKLLIFKSTESSLHFYFVDTKNQDNNAAGEFKKFGTKNSSFIFKSNKGEITNKTSIKGIKEALDMLATQLKQSGNINLIKELHAAGHIIQFGGDEFINSAVIDDNVIEKLSTLSSKGILKDDINSIRTIIDFLFSIPHIAIFDTAFHHTIPAYAHLYETIHNFNNKNRRYVYHGLIHSYAALKASEYLKLPYNSLEIAVCNLDKISSICAVDHGRSVDTYTGISDISENFTEIEEAADKGTYEALLAVKTFCYQVRKYIGSYVAAMAGLDVLVFTGIIKSPNIRSLICQGLECIGIKLNNRLNNKAAENNGVCEISQNDSNVKVLVIPKREEIMAAREMIKAIDNEKISKRINSNKARPVPIEISAHHIHLSDEDLEQLFGRGYKLTNDIELSQPGQYACKERVNLKGPKGTINRVRILSPTRKQTQVEIAMTEQYKLGIQPPIRESGDVENTPGITLETEDGSLTINQGVICAMRHIHMTPGDAFYFGLRNKDIVRIIVAGDRELIFGDVLVRVSPKYQLVMHIDTDEGNAANIKTGMQGYIDSIQERR